MSKTHYPSSGFKSIEIIKGNQQKQQQQQIFLASEQLLSFAVNTFLLIWDAFTRAKTVYT